jgi:hypothetical protein
LENMGMGGGGEVGEDEMGSEVSDGNGGRLRKRRG